MGNPSSLNDEMTVNKKFNSILWIPLSPNINIIL